MRHFTYYNTLNAQWQKVFVDRCLYFATQKIIIGAEGFVPNNMVKSIISASAVQLTLGLEIWKLDYFETIILHPGNFEDKASGLKFKGETNLAGFVQLSWKSFIAGYRVANDNINLGLHEFTHALRFNPIRGYDQDYFIEHYFHSWLASANEAFNDIRENKKTIFRKYGGTNINEFLSVCVEHFFESAHQIKEHYPLLYYSTAIMLNQQTIENQTEVEVRQKLFDEKNNFLQIKNEFNTQTKWNKTKSFKIMMIILIPFIYTAIITGVSSGASLILFLLIFAFYLRFDFYFMKIKLSNNHFFLQKGFLLFKNRKKIKILLSQLISFRFYGNKSGDSELELIYYDLSDRWFYIENIPTGKKFENAFLNEVINNRIAVFKD